MRTATIRIVLTTVLVHSPFLGPTSLQPLATALRRPTALPSLTGAVVGAPPYQPRISAAAAHAVPPSELVLVGHSGAGPLLPGIAETLGPTVRALLFLDAGLPTPGRSWMEASPAELARQLAELAEDGVLPPWHEWFGPDLLPTVVPDDALRHQVVAELPRVPLAFMEEPRSSADWAGPAGYLRLSAAYDDAAELAERRGWPVRWLDTHHLAPTSRPDEVAAALIELLDVQALPAR